MSDYNSPKVGITFNKAVKNMGLNNISIEIDLPLASIEIDFDFNNELEQFKDEALSENC